jgi:hypothetical protein
MVASESVRLHAGCKSKNCGVPHRTRKILGILAICGVGGGGSLRGKKGEEGRGLSSITQLIGCR